MFWAVMIAVFAVLGGGRYRSTMPYGKATAGRGSVRPAFCSPSGRRVPGIDQRHIGITAAK